MNGSHETFNADWTPMIKLTGDNTGHLHKTATFYLKILGPLSVYYDIDYPPFLANGPLATVSPCFTI